MDKLAKKLTKFLVIPAATMVMGLTAYAAPSITVSSYADEEVTIGSITAGASVEYSLDKVNWTPLLGTKIDVSTLLGKTLYVREIGKTDAVDITSSPLAKRPAAPSTVKFIADAAGAGPGSDKINVEGTQEYKVDNLDWHVGTGSGAGAGIVVGDAEKLGAKFSVRTKATGAAFASLTATVTVPQSVVAPVVKYDEKKDVIFVKAGQEYKLGGSSAAVGGSGWTPVTAPAGVEVSRAAFTGGNASFYTNGKVLENDEVKFFVYVRTKGASTTRPASAAAKVQFPDVPDIGAPTSVLNFADEKVTDVNSTMEYRVLTTNQYNAKTYSTPAWTTVSGSEINMTTLFSPYTVGAQDEKTKLEVRYKAVPATATAIAKPASDIQLTAIVKRATTPTGKSLNTPGTLGVGEIDFDYRAYGDEKIAVASTLQYKIGTTGEWTDGTGNAVSVVDYIPASGVEPIYLRVKATDAIPASKEFSHPKLAVAARAKMPTAKFTASNRTISGVVAGMYWKDPYAGTAINGGAAVAAFTDILTSTKVIGGYHGSMRDVSIYAPATPYAFTAGAPATIAIPTSDTQVLTCEFQPRVNVLSGNIGFAPDDLTGFDGVDVGTVGFTGGYSVNGVKDGAATIAYTLGTLPNSLDTDGTAEGDELVIAAGVISVGSGLTIPAGIHNIPIIATYTDSTVGAGSIPAVVYKQTIPITITKPLGQAITGIGTVAGVVQVGQITKPIAATTAGSTGATTYTWTSSDTTVATILNSATVGEITAVAAGTTTISYLSDTGYANSITITVYPAAATLNPTYGTVISSTVNGPVTNAAAIAAAAGSNTVNFVSSATAKATVDSTTGVITGVAAGATTVTLTITDPTTGQITHKGSATVTLAS